MVAPTGAWPTNRTSTPGRRVSYSVPVSHFGQGSPAWSDSWRTSTFSAAL